MQRLVSIIISVLLIVIHVFCNAELLLDTDICWAIRALVYPFFHANIFHLAANILGVLSLSKWRGERGVCWNIVLPFVISFLVYPCSVMPLIGMSNVIYAFIGLHTPSFQSKWWVHPSVIVFFVITFAMVFVPGISAVTHILAFLFGVVLAVIRRWVKSIMKDAAGYIR